MAEVLSGQEDSSLKSLSISGLNPVMSREPRNTKCCSYPPQGKSRATSSSLPQYDAPGFTESQRWFTVDDKPQSSSLTYGDDVESVNTFIDSLDSFEKKKQIVPIPDEVHKMIEELCAKHNVRCPIWLQSPGDSNRVNILGIGARRMQADLKFPGFEFDTIESGPLHIKQYAFDVIGKVIADKTDPGEGERNSTATCDLILEGEERDKDNPLDRVLYAIVPAHLILSVPQCDKLVRCEDPVDIQDMREEVNSQVGWTRYLLKKRKSKEIMDLRHPALISYRRYYDGTAEQEIPGTRNFQCWARKCTLQNVLDYCPHHFINDIAVLSIDHQNTERFRQAIQQDRNSRDRISYAGIIPVSNFDQIVRLLNHNPDLFAGDLRCQLWPSYTTNSDEQHRLAFFIAFIMAEPADGLEPGDSGTIIYTLFGGRKHAVAMFTGEFDFGDTPHPSHQPVYQAIVLSPALRDIEIAYPHRVRNLRLQ